MAVPLIAASSSDNILLAILEELKGLRAAAQPASAPGDALPHGSVELREPAPQAQGRRRR